MTVTINEQRPDPLTANFKPMPVTVDRGPDMAFRFSSRVESPDELLKACLESAKLAKAIIADDFRGDDDDEPALAVEVVVHYIW